MISVEKNEDLTGAFSIHSQISKGEQRSKPDIETFEEEHPTLSRLLSKSQIDFVFCDFNKSAESQSGGEKLRMLDDENVDSQLVLSQLTSIENAETESKSKIMDSNDDLSSQQKISEIRSDLMTKESIDLNAEHYKNTSSEKSGEDIDCFYMAESGEIFTNDAGEKNSQIEIIPRDVDIGHLMTKNVVDYSSSMPKYVQDAQYKASKSCMINRMKRRDRYDNKFSESTMLRTYRRPNLEALKKVNISSKSSETSKNSDDSPTNKSKKMIPLYSSSISSFSIDELKFHPKTNRSKENNPQNNQSKQRIKLSEVCEVFQKKPKNIPNQ